MKRRAEQEENSSSKKPKYDSMPLDDVQVIDKSNASAVARDVMATPELRSLELSYMQISGNAAALFFAGLRGNKCVASIDISRNDLGSEGAKAIAQFLQGNTALTELDLSYSKISSNGLMSVVNALDGNSSLKNLALRDNDIGDEPIKALMRLLGNNTLCLEALYIERVGIESGFADIAEMLKTNKSLKILNLSGNFISSPEVALFGDALQFNCTLQSLDISGIDEKGAYDGQQLESEHLYSFTDGIKKNKCLIELDLPSIDSCSNAAVKNYYAAMASHKTMLYCTALNNRDGLKSDNEKLRLMLQKKNREFLLNPLLRPYDPGVMLGMKDVVVFLGNNKAVDGALKYSYGKPGSYMFLHGAQYYEYVVSPSVFYLNLNVEFYKGRCRSALIAILAATNEHSPLIDSLPRFILRYVLELSGDLGEKKVAQALGMQL